MRATTLFFGSEPPANNFLRPLTHVEIISVYIDETVEIDVEFFCSRPSTRLEFCVNRSARVFNFSTVRLKILMRVDDIKATESNWTTIAKILNPGTQLLYNRFIILAHFTAKKQIL